MAESVAGGELGERFKVEFGWRISCAIVLGVTVEKKKTTAVAVRILFKADILIEDFRPSESADAILLGARKQFDVLHCEVFRELTASPGQMS